MTEIKEPQELLDTIQIHDESLPEFDSLLTYVSSEISKQQKNNHPHLREILDAMFPPRVFVAQDNQSVTECVSAEPAGRNDVLSLQMNLDNQLQDRQARETGVCPVREELFSQGFDELIRQITIECPERGLLLLRVRDEIKMTIAAHTTLYESSNIFGVRKGLQAEQGGSKLDQQVKDIEGKKTELEHRVQELRTLYEALEKAEAERRVMEEKKRQKEKEFLRYQSQHLEAFLKAQSVNN